MPDDHLVDELIPRRECGLDGLTWSARENFRKSYLYYLGRH